MTDKVAGSTDPKQQALRDLKKQWQKEMKIFIAQNIALKRGIGGVGDPKAGIPSSKIKDPLPNEVSIYISEMVTRFNNLVDIAKNIVDEQDDYSKNRRKGRSEASYNNEILKEASNEFTRFISKLRHGLWFSSDQGAKEKIRLMSSLAEFEDHINEIEYVLASNDDRAISKSFFEFVRFLGLFRNRFVIRLSKEIERQSKEFKQKGDYLDEDVVSPVTLPSKSFQNVLKDLGEETNDSRKEDAKLKENEEKNISNKPSEQDNSSDLDNINIVISKINSLSELGIANIPKINDVDINKLLSKTKEALINSEDPSYYNNILGSVKEYLKVSDIDFSDSKNLGEILGKLMKVSNSSISDDSIKKIAKLRFKRWQRRLMLSFHQDEFSKSKLDTVKKLRDLGKYMNSILSLLEGRDTKIGEVITVVSKMYEYISDICYDFASMANDHNATYGAERSSGNKTLLILINKGDINSVIKDHQFYIDQANILKQGSITQGISDE